MLLWNIPGKATDFFEKERGCHLSYSLTEISEHLLTPIIIFALRSRLIALVNIIITPGSIVSPDR
jgi:hypothetical protein